jgi:uncharacterized membrane protein
MPLVAISVPFEDRLEEVIDRTGAKLGPEVAAQLRTLKEPVTLGIIAATLAAWVVGHAFGYGEAIDIVIAVVGVLTIGLAVFSGLDELFEFAYDTYSARDSADLDRAADHLAKAIAILGVQAVLAILLKNAPKGGRVKLAAKPATAPSIVFDSSLRPGYGRTSFWGEITVSTQGTAEDQAVVLLHEKVHQFFSVRLNQLKTVRVENRAGSYFKSSLYRYFEEASAEAIGQLGGAGFLTMFKGIRFPIKSGYVYFLRAGGYSPAMAGAGLLPEAAALIGAGSAPGFAFELWFVENGKSQTPDGATAPQGSR